MRQNCSSPILQAPETVSGVHREGELTGNDLVLGRFSGTSPSRCSFVASRAPWRWLHVSPSAPAAPRSAGASPRTDVGSDGSLPVEPVIARVFHQPPTGLDEALLHVGERPVRLKLLKSFSVDILHEFVRLVRLVLRKYYVRTIPPCRRRARRRAGPKRRSGKWKRRRSVSAVSMASSEYFRCPPRRGLPCGDASGAPTR